jgi:alkaline phosphatase D
MDEREFASLDTQKASGRVALLSCMYDLMGTNIQQIWKKVEESKPDALFLLGDNVYGDIGGVVFGPQLLWQRYIDTRRNLPLYHWRKLIPAFAIWDDHDFGPDNSDRGFIQKEATLEAFRLFWANPTSGLPDQEGITSQFQWADIDFFLLDNRFSRAPDERKTGERTQFGKTQLEWLIDALKTSKAPFKMVATGGQFLSAAPTAENHIRFYPEERAYLIKRIEEEGLKNIIFLTGDRHFTELTELKLSNGKYIYDLTVSPLTSGVNTNPEINILRVPGTEVTEHNFGLLTFSGKRLERKLTIKIFDALGNEKWKKEILSE